MEKKYVILDLDYNENEDYIPLYPLDKVEIGTQDNTMDFVETVISKIESLSGEYICDIGFEPFVLEEDASALVEGINLNSIDILDDYVFATCLVESGEVDNGLECVGEDVVHLESLYEEFYNRGYELPRVTSKDIESDILNGTMLSRETLLTKIGRTKN